MQQVLRKKPVFTVREVPVYGDAILSPMAGFSDLPYRSLCREYGSAMSYTEFVSVIAFLAGPNRKTLQMLDFLPCERPVVFQIFDADEDRIVEVALRLEEMGPDIIDLNMGCSVRKVSGRGAGAGLLRDPSKIGRIFARLSQALRVPVTGKIRLGWDGDSLNYLEVVRALQDNGASLVAVHGRTKQQGYQGEADWDAIARIVEVARVPVIGNGDVRTPEDIQRLKRRTGCQAVMIGRGAIGHPWIFQRRSRSEIPFSDKALFILRHFGRMASFYGQSTALILIRKHIARYLKDYSGIKDLHRQLVQVGSVEQLEDLLEQVTVRLASTSCQAA
ncbi:MAG: tRNA dihydrouridine synthase DusB [Acidobacteriota bacterium]